MSHHVMIVSGWYIVGMGEVVWGTYQGRVIFVKLCICQATDAKATMPPL